MTPEQIQELPVDDRNFENLGILIAPGVQRERGGFRFIGGSPLIGSSGTPRRRPSRSMRGACYFTDQALGLARARFSQDAVGEFRVINNRFDTESAAQIWRRLSVITKSGSNEVHGSAFRLPYPKRFAA